MPRLLVLVVACAACSWLSPRPDRTRFYVLAAVPPEVDPPPVAQPLVGLGPIALPPYLERPQLVTRLAQNELRISEGEQWAEPLNRGFARVLARDVELALGPGSVVLFPWPRSAAPRWSVSIDVQRSERLAVGEVELTARWTLRDAKSGEVLVASDESIRDRMRDQSGEAAVAALSRALAALGQNIVRAQSRLNRGGP